MTSDRTEQRPHAGTAVTGQWIDVEHMAKSGNRVQAEVRQGTGPPLVLLPGTWGNAQIRGRLADNLDLDLTLVCVALAGQDGNWPPPSHPSIEQFSRDTLDLADELGLTRFFIAGNSLGGMIAIDMLRLCPERVFGAIPEKENIQVEWVPGASHNLLIEAPVKLAALMNRFVEITIASATTQEEP